ncbi:protein of unassigned function [Methylobacterium oryzae CBMB20]|uniref:Protein of unassigned function n=1 Tax=Methylobacterium oryzae CBMB20 TaxID=693986 RepID=A0A089P419_9HYPH|nr:protein of unassigned function [Methylobacterium oryzae CBMB20]
MTRWRGSRQADPDKSSLVNVVTGKSPRLRDVPPAFRVEHYPTDSGCRGRAVRRNAGGRTETAR